jgi:hypothetical protein
MGNNGAFILRCGVLDWRGDLSRYACLGTTHLFVFIFSESNNIYWEREIRLGLIIYINEWEWWKDARAAAGGEGQITEEGDSFC